MENEENESVNNLEVAEQEETVESTVEAETVEETEEVEEAQEEIKTETEQSKEENAKYASARRRAEEEAQRQIEQARKEAYEQGLQQGKTTSFIGMHNPYTGKEIQDEYDAREYLEMFDLDKKGKDPIEGYRELQKEKEKKEVEERLKAEEKSKQDLWFQNDTKDFIEKYSAEKLQELTKNADFNLFASGKIGKIELSKIYEDYQKLISKYEKKSVETAKQIIANNNTTPGAIEEGETQELNWNDMSKEEFEKYLQRAKDGELK